jgi:hypothetical protein
MSIGISEDTSAIMVLQKGTPKVTEPLEAAVIEALGMY